MDGWYGRRFFFNLQRGNDETTLASLFCELRRWPAGWAKKTEAKSTTTTRRARERRVTGIQQKGICSNGTTSHAIRLVVFSIVTLLAGGFKCFFSFNVHPYLGK